MIITVDSGTQPPKNKSENIKMRTSFLNNQGCCIHTIDHVCVVRIFRGKHSWSKSHIQLMIHERTDRSGRVLSFGAAARAGGPSSQPFPSPNQLKSRRSNSTYNNTLCPIAKSMPLPIFRQRSFGTKDLRVNNDYEQRPNILAKHRYWTAVAKFFAK